MLFATYKVRDYSTKKRDREGTVTTENLTRGPTMATFDFTTSYRSKILFVDSVDHVEVVFRTTHTQNITNILIDRDYMMMMNHGGATQPAPRHKTTNQDHRPLFPPVEDTVGRDGRCHGLSATVDSGA